MMSTDYVKPRIARMRNSLPDGYQFGDANVYRSGNLNTWPLIVVSDEIVLNLKQQRDLSRLINGEFDSREWGV
jgi:hypothetical protein